MRLLNLSENHRKAR